MFLFFKKQVPPENVWKCFCLEKRAMFKVAFFLQIFKVAHDHLQNVISRSLARFWESFALGTSMPRDY